VRLGGGERGGRKKRGNSKGGSSGASGLGVAAPPSGREAKLIPRDECETTLSHVESGGHKTANRKTTSSVFEGEGKKDHSEGKINS